MGYSKAAILSNQAPALKSSLWQMSVSDCTMLCCCWSSLQIIEFWQGKVGSCPIDEDPYHQDEDDPPKHPTTAAAQNDMWWTVFMTRVTGLTWELVKLAHMPGPCVLLPHHWPWLSSMHDTQMTSACSLWPSVLIPPEVYAVESRKKVLTGSQTMSTPPHKQVAARHFVAYTACPSCLLDWWSGHTLSRK